MQSLTYLELRDKTDEAVQRYLRSDTEIRDFFREIAQLSRIPIRETEIEPKPDPQPMSMTWLDQDYGLDDT